MSHRYLILGLLAQRPMTGYDIKQQVQDILSRIVNASYGTLYPTLHRLLVEQAVEVEEIQQERRPSKKVYHITEQGRQELEAWLRRPALADQIRSEFLLKLYLGVGMAKQDLLNLLASRRLETEIMQTALRGGLEGAEGLQQLWVKDYMLALCQAEIDWLSRVQAQVMAAGLNTPP